MSLCGPTSQNWRLMKNDTLKTLTSLNRESRPFFLGESSIWGVFPLFLPLAITACGGPERYFSLALIAFGAFEFIVPKYENRLGNRSVFTRPFFLFAPFADPSSSPFLHLTPLRKMLCSVEQEDSTDWKGVFQDGPLHKFQEGNSFPKSAWKTVRKPSWRLPPSSSTPLFRHPDKGSLTFCCWQTQAKIAVTAAVDNLRKLFESSLLSSSLSS